MTPIAPSRRLGEVRYEIRGELARRARELEAQGHDILKLNIGNPGAFGFEAPDAIRNAVAAGLAESAAYCHQQGLPEAREAIAGAVTARGIAGIDSSRVFIGNGVSELIDLSLRALLESGDEVLLPSPDYPLWSAATVLNHGVARYYPCPPERCFLPDPVEIEAAISPKTRAIVLINPNNPTGAVYPKVLLAEIVAIARRHSLLLMVDEIYDNILFGDARFIPTASLAGDHPVLSFGGLSKVHRACGYRVGWAVMSGDAAASEGYRHGLDLLAALRLCANVPGQWAVPAALNGVSCITDLTGAGGRLHEARAAVVEACAASEHLQLVAPAGALYAFPSVQGAAAQDFNDHHFALELLENEHVLVVPGSSFNFGRRDHFRVTLLPTPDVLRDVFTRIDHRLGEIAGRARRAA